MNDKDKNLLLRVVSAVLLLPVILFLLVKGGAWSAGLMGVAATVCASEYYLIVFKRLGSAAVVNMVAALALPFLPVWLGENAGEAAFGVLVFVFLSSWVQTLLVVRGAETTNTAAHLVSGFIYGAAGLACLSWLRQLEDGLAWVTCALIITWGNDTLAYFAGRFLGRRKLAPAISPNKTWEGFFGGMVGSIGGMFIAKLTFFPAITAVDCVVVGFAGSMLGPLGDLSESMLKRAHAVKDSGKILPGHGGLLDRIDALLFNGPWVLLYVTVSRMV